MSDTPSFGEVIDELRGRSAALAPRMAAALAVLCATCARSVTMRFFDASGRLDDFYSLNNPIDDIWRDLRGISNSSLAQLNAGRNQIDRFQRELEMVDGEAAGFASDALDIAVNAIETFISGDSHVSTDCVVGLIDLGGRMADFIADRSQDHEAGVFVVSEILSRLLAADLIADIEWLKEFDTGSQGASLTKFMARAGDRNLRLGEMIDSVLQFDAARLPLR